MIPCTIESHQRYIVASQPCPICPEVTYEVTVKVHEMGEDTFVEKSFDTLGAALMEFSHLIGEYCAHDETCIEWHLVDTTGGDPNVSHEVQWTCEVVDGDDHDTCDYIMQITRIER